MIQQGRLLLLISLTLIGSQALALEPNDDWVNATSLGYANSVSDQIDFTTYGPDTVLGVFDEVGGLLAVDDDSSIFGNGFASAILDQPINADGSINFKLTGFGDFDFDGLVDEDGTDHFESGDFEIYVTLYDALGIAFDSFDVVDTLDTGEVIDFNFSDPGWLGGSYDAEVNNFFGPPSDVDFWAFDNLTSGQFFTAEITSGDFDSLLGLYDNSGSLIDSDDEGGIEGLSKLTGTVPAEGILYFAVTAYPDFFFEGTHGAFGSYTLELTTRFPGDYNDDGNVDAADFTVWRDNLGANAEAIPNNPHTDVIGADEYNTWVANYGATTNSSSSNAVPEPNSALAISVVFLVAILRPMRD